MPVMSFLRFEIAGLKTGLSRFEAEMRIIRDAIRDYYEMSLQDIYKSRMDGT